MDMIDQFATALQDAGLGPALVDDEDGPYHIAVPLPGLSVLDDPVIRINLLDSHDGDLELWQMNCVFPEQAASEDVWEMVKATIHTVNRSMVAGKVLVDDASQMLFATYSHMTTPGGAALLSGPPVVAFFRDHCAALAPELAGALTTEIAQDLDEIVDDLTRTQQELEAILANLTKPA